MEKSVFQIFFKLVSVMVRFKSKVRSYVDDGYLTFSFIMRCQN